MKDTKIVNREIPGLPKVLSQDAREPIDITGSGLRHQLCGRLGPNERCGPLDHWIRMYGLMHLFKVQDIYDILAKQEYQEALSYLPQKAVVGPAHIHVAMEKYFQSKGVNLPRLDTTEYEALVMENPIAEMFDLLRKEYRIVSTFTSEDQRPTTPEQFGSRLKKVIPYEYFMQIDG